MARSSLTYILGFSAKFFFQPIYTDYANWAYFERRRFKCDLLSKYAQFA
jgi:hypothetical protein